MTNIPKIYASDSDVAALISELITAGKPLEVAVGDVTYELAVRKTTPPADLWAEYDEVAALEALERSAGVLKDIDAETLINRLREEREQDSTAHPAPR